MIKTRIEEKSNYRATWINGKTIRFAIDPTKPILELEHPEFYDIKITNNCFGKCQYCLTDDTYIKTPGGEKKISEINLSDDVFTINQKSYELEINLVEQVHERSYDGYIIEIELENNRTIKITPEHRVYTKNRGWIKADSLNNDDILLEL